MAKPVKSATGWKIQIQVKGNRVAKTFATKSEALEWAAQQRLAVQPSTVSGITFYDLCLRWHERFAESRKYALRERQRIEWHKDDPLFKTKLRDLSGKQIADWRDRCLSKSAAGTVKRDWTLFSSICTQAVREMDLMASNPFSKAKCPPEPPPRTRVPTDAELAEIRKWANPHIGNIITFATETGMRLSEISGLQWSDVSGRAALLRTTKNGDQREVPLSRAAIAAMGDRGIGSVFGLSSPQIYYHWKQAVLSARVDGVTFHDLRAYACVKLAKVLQPLQLAKMMGWRNVSMAMVYFRQSSDEIADALDAGQ